MADETQQKILHLLDVLSVEVNATRAGVEALATQTSAGFERVERRLAHVEMRVETVETELRAFRGEFDHRVSSLERR